MTTSMSSCEAAASEKQLFWKSAEIQDFEAYLYQPLRETDLEIRLLDVLPLTGESDTLTCRVRTVSLLRDPKPIYETLSYCWGDPTPCHKILLDDSVLVVPESSALALRRVAFQDHIRTVWIDAICINQNDIAERSSQVAIMGKIYSLSCRTLVYLGEEDATTSRAFDNLRKITAEIQGDLGHHDRLYRLLALDNSEWADAPSPPRISIDTEALATLFGKPWFMRVWIIQEIVLAPVSYCYCGTQHMDLLELLDAAAWLHIWHFYHIPTDLHRSSGLQAAGTLWYQYLRTPSASKLLLASGLVMTLGLGVTDSRDRVYGVLGMTHRDKDIPYLLYPDYEKSASHTFRDAIRYIFAYEAESGILQRLFHRDNDELLDPAWPSWVPRFDRNHDSRFDPGPLSNSYNQRNRRSIKLSSDDPDQTFEAECNILNLIGVLPLAITKVSDTEIYDECPWAAMKQWLMEVVDMTPSVTSDEPSPSTSIVQLARTLMTGYTFQGQCAEDQDCLEILAFWQLFAENRGGWRDIKDIGDINSAAEDPVSKASRFYYAMKGPCSLRKFAVVSTDCLALVPRVCREGDIIAIMHTCIKPLALRPLDGGNFQLLGECYLDGYMWEEERDMLDQQGQEDVAFNIE